MLSAMTTSENFPLINQSRCTPSTTYNPVIQPGYVATILRQNLQVMSADGNILKYQLIQEPEINGGKLAPATSYYLTNSTKETYDFPLDSLQDGENKEAECSSPSSKFTKSEFENELAELLEQLDLDDSIYEQTKPLKIDPNVLKLDFSKITIAGDIEVLERLYSTDNAENKRASHHLSGGSLLSDASQDDFRNTANKLSSGGGIVTKEADINFDCFNASSDSGTGLVNQISPSTPLTFDLSSQNEFVKNVTNCCGVSNSGNGTAVSSIPESTNPFRNYLEGVRKDEKSFSPTNPFNDLCSSSLNGIPSNPSSLPPVPSPPPIKYENIILPQKSFSQCSTRPASPVLKIPDDSSISNPFLINDTSPGSYDPPVPQFFVKDSNFPESALKNRSSFIFAVPVLSILPQNITNSSTQTGDLIEPSKPETPVYQNLTNQLEKFVKKNDHSEYDLLCLKTTVKDLRTSGWYYENVSWQESVILLKDTEPGTFLIRDSSDPNFLFSLSVQTSRGPTSVRLHYVNGHFRLDAEEKLIPHMPSFSSVIELIDYYVENTVKNKTSHRHQRSSSKVKSNGKSFSIQKSKDQVWIDSQGNVYSNILLVKPLYKKDHFSTLQHLARLTINTYVKKRLNANVKLNFKVTPVYESSPFQDSSFQNCPDSFCPILSMDALPIPPKLIEYLQDYPYCH